MDKEIRNRLSGELQRLSPEESTYLKEEIKALTTHESSLLR